VAGEGGMTSYVFLTASFDILLALGVDAGSWMCYTMSRMGQCSAESKGVGG
jgi:hypothetical protein